MLLKAISFDYGTLSEDAGLSVGGNAPASIVTTKNRTGTRSLKINPGGADFYSWGKCLFASALGEFFLQYAFYMDGPCTANRKIFKWCNATTVLGGLIFNYVTQKIEVYTGDFVTKVGETTVTYTSGQWYVLELHIKIADSGGIIILRSDLAEQVNFSGDTQPGAATTVDNVVWGNIISYGYSCYIDDIILHDITGSYNNGWPGAAKVLLLFPNGDGTTLEWTPQPTGTHYTTVDEVPPSGTDYLKAATADNVDELSIENLPVEAAAIKAAIVEAFAFRGSDNPPTKLSLGLKLGGTPYYSEDLTLTGAQSCIKKLWEEHPAGGVFLPADIDSALLLLKSRT